MKRLDFIYCDLSGFRIVDKLCTLVAKFCAFWLPETVYSYLPKTVQY